MSSDATLPALTSVIRQYELQPRKALGQNFLVDPQLLEKIARQALPFGNDHLVEIGPGPGGLTRALLACKPARLTVIEKDNRCVNALQELAEYYPQKLQVLEADALQVDVSVLGMPPYILAGNLPYNVATPILLRWLDVMAGHPGSVRRMVFMFQKEVAERIMAVPGSKTYGRLSIVSQWLCDVRKGFDIAPAAFYPPPKVTSSVVIFEPRKSPATGFAKAVLEQVTQAAFGQRRKQLRKALQACAGQVGMDSAEWLEQAGIKPDQRAESVPPEGFFQLARVLTEWKLHLPRNGSLPPP